MAKKAKDKIAASIKIERASDISEQGRRDIAAWLRMHAKHLLKHGDNYAPKFTGSYRYA